MRMLVFVLVLLGMGRVSISAQLSIQPKGADAAIKAAKGKVGAENLCKDKPPCEDKRQCTDFFSFHTTSLSVSNTFFFEKSQVIFRENVLNRRESARYRRTRRSKEHPATTGIVVR